MKILALLLKIFFFIVFLVLVGCRQNTLDTQPSSQGHVDTTAPIYTGYSPTKIDILPLTELVTLNGPEEGFKVKAYVGLLDSFSSQKKSPGIFRFELYEYVQRSTEPKGKRVEIWSDIDLTDAIENNKYWRDFLRAYEFDLDFENGSEGSYILLTTFLCPDGKRISDEFVLKRAE